MISILHETQIFGPLYMYGCYLQADNITIEAAENYQKRTFRNRYDLLTTNGMKTMSIPLNKGKNSQQPIRDVTISYHENWVNQHLNTIQSAYGKSPFFEFYFQDIKTLYEKKHTFLFDLNLDCLLYMLNKLKLSKSISFAESYEIYKSNTYISCKNDANGVFSVVRYPQVWNSKFDFIPNLSILDLLFCMGPEAISILSKINKYK
ncbi:MAG: WbqC family protein [Saprospiraceae bacterium]|jgi:hypothetical protein|nr:WbqC family protein [Saprospiraceae bacterium]